MQVKAWVEYTGEVDVEVTADDIQTALIGDDDRRYTVRNTLNSFSQYMDSISSDLINEYFDEDTKKMIREYLLKELKRFGG